SQPEVRSLEPFQAFFVLCQRKPRQIPPKKSHSTP
ncbi:MAG: hypothetical protein RIQ85_950, partial [Pseudomonadota bacterium]